METYIFTRKIFNSLMLILVLSVVIASCKKESAKRSTGAPAIIKIRAISPAPNDSTLNKVGPGQVVVIQGSNLLGVSAIYFNGIKGSFNPALVADNNVVVIVPGIDFTKPQGAQENTVKLVTNAGETTFKIPVLPPPPIITALSNEYAAPGTTVTLYGQYLYLINKISFPGGDATNIVTSVDGLSLTLTIPPTATPGSIVVDGKGGKGVFAFYADKVTGMICNFDDVNTYAGNATIRNDATTFPGSIGSYAEITTGTPLPPFTYNQGQGRSIILNAVQWVPQANINDPIANYVLKFEASVTKPWSGGTVMIRRDENSWLFLARYEPWKTAPNLSFVSNGWTTVTIPLTNFRSKGSAGEGTANSANDLTTLINATGKRPMVFMLINDQSVAATTVLDIAIDNIRIVKIK